MNENEINELLLAWAKEVQSLNRENSGGPAVLKSFLELNELARDAAKDLPFDCEPSNFVRALEELAREPDEDG